MRQANENSGYIGVGIVGSFVLVVCGWYGGRWGFGKWKSGLGTGLMMV
jgi:nickel/cobalt transporter (NiCoT) family protein